MTKTRLVLVLVGISLLLGNVSGALAEEDLQDPTPTPSPLTPELMWLLGEYWILGLEEAQEPICGTDCAYWRRVANEVWAITNEKKLVPLSELDETSILLELEEEYLRPVPVGDIETCITYEVFSDGSSATCIEEPDFCKSGIACEWQIVVLDVTEASREDFPFTRKCLVDGGWFPCKETFAAYPGRLLENGTRMSWGLHGHFLKGLPLDVAYECYIGGISEGNDGNPAILGDFVLASFPAPSKFVEAKNNFMTYFWATTSERLTDYALKREEMGLITMYTLNIGYTEVGMLSDCP